MNRPQSWRAGAVGALVLFVVGCGALPTEPLNHGTADSPPGQVAMSALARAPSPDVASGPPIRTIDPSEVAQAEIVGEAGGVVRARHVTLDVPKGAYHGSARISMVVADTSVLQCQLDITPATKNQFNVPVTLRFDATGRGDVQLLKVWWFNPDSGKWVPVACTIDATHRTVSAKLSHFSLYKCAGDPQGRAGW
jgi:hypothetical protein